MKKAIARILGLILAFAAGEVKSQLTEIQRTPEADFQTGIFYIQQNMYGAARDVFTRLLDDNKNLTADQRLNAEYYRAIAAVQMLHPDGEFLLEKFIQDYETSAKANEARLYMGDFLFKNRQYKRAVKYYQQADWTLMNAAERAKIQFQYGYSLFSTDDQDGAEKQFAAVKDGKSQYAAPALYYYAYICYMKERYDEALVNFEKLRNDKNFGGMVPYYLAHIYYKKGEYDKLLAVGKEILEGDEPARASEIAKLVADAYYRRKDYKNALTYYTKFLEKGGKPSQTDYYEIGYTYYQLGKYSEAVQFFNKITNAREEIAQNAHYMLGDCYLKLGMRQEAAGAFKAAARSDKNLEVQEDAFYNFVKINYTETSPFQNPIEAAEEYLKLFPQSRHSKEINRLLASLYSNSSDYARAAVALEQAGLDSPEMREAWQRVQYFLGVRSYTSRQYAQAITHFKRSLEQPLNPRFTALAYYWMGETYYQLMEYDAALNAFNQFASTPQASLLAEFPNHYYNKAYCYLKKQQFAQAATEFRKFLTEKNLTAARRRDALLRTGDAYMMINQFELAQDFYSRAEAAGADPDYTRFQRALALGLLNKNDEKIQVLRKLIESSSNDNTRAAARMELGNTWLLVDRFTEAAGAFDEFIKFHPRHPQVRRALMSKALALKNARRFDEALTILKNLVAQYPESPEAAEAIGFARIIYAETNRMGEYVDWVDRNKLGNISRGQLDSSLYNNAYELYSMQRWQEAAQGFDEYLRRFPEGIFVQRAENFMADSYWRLNRRADAVQIYERIASKPNHAYFENASMRAGSYYFDQKDWPSARRMYQQIADLSNARESNRHIAENQLLRIAYQMGDWNECQNLADQILQRRDLDQALSQEATFYRALALFNRQQQALAVADFETLARSGSGIYKAESMYYLALHYYIQQRYSDSKKLVYYLVEDFPENIQLRDRALILLARNFIAERDYFQADFSLDFVIKSNSSPDLVNEARALKNDIKNFTQKK
ncbi:tetratricopeptide repeat protein [Thermaurantimonas aggregans]|uniref:tetratricopeptide repeat protein n=1 Tax=Thermaurantimonas aggregans TaxID=2173829 RepID=UPI0023EFB7DD|nr:tetratricopeptide repeat protein [Thermaurantimonas aggregans]MCX8147853.1 tetratricopeptide repeat protein [Thermaurantimonas aggregans]